MLENGADVRFIQQLLGHVNLTTTEIYTRVSIKALKEVHERTHPGAGGGPGAGDGGEGDAAAREELLAALAEEAEEEAETEK